MKGKAFYKPAFGHWYTNRPLHLPVRHYSYFLRLRLHLQAHFHPLPWWLHRLIVGHLLNQPAGLFLRVPSPVVHCFLFCKFWCKNCCIVKLKI